MGMCLKLEKLNNMQYVIEHLINSTYCVILLEGENESMVFQGSIAECEAWVRVYLKTGEL